MNRKISLGLFLAASFVISTISVCYAQEWELIGEKKAFKDNTYVEIAINDQEAFYKELKFGVKSADIKIKKIIVYSVDGNENEYKIDSPAWIEPGEKTSPISLSEAGLSLTKVKLNFYTKKNVVVEFYGKK
jgi:hypothetical protein